MNIHFRLDVLPNRKWHNRRGSTHLAKGRVDEDGGREERKKGMRRRVMEEHGKWRQKAMAAGV